MKANPQLVTRRYIISGRVQGVGYRAFTRQLALRLNLLGWVRNLPDGRVEAVAAGSAQGLQAFESQLREGPPHGSVDSVNISDEPAGNFSDFEIRRDE